MSKLDVDALKKDLPSSYRDRMPTDRVVAIFHGQHAGRSSIATNATVAEFGDVHQEKNKFVFTVKKHKSRRTHGKGPVVLSDTTYKGL